MIRYTQVVDASKANDLLVLLEHTAHRMGVAVRYERLLGHEAEVLSKGGFCIVKGKKTILIHRDLSAIEKCHVLIGSLQGIDLDHVYVPPVVRKALLACKG